MRHGSLFSGIGGFDLAAEWMGWENVFHCEWNPFGQRVLKHYWSNAITYNDITKTDFTIHRGTVDILTGGFPCQPFSTAGKRLGKEDERHLWPHMLRAIREIRPRYVVGENVRGILSWSDGLVFDEVCSDLESEGYEVQAFVLPACGINAPHKRERVWVIAKQILADTDSGRLERTTPLGRNCEYVERESKFRLTADTEATQNTMRGGCTHGESEQERTGIREQRNISTGVADGLHLSTGLTADTDGKRHEERQPSTISNRQKRFDSETNTFGKPGGWENFPSQSPICSGDDGLPSELDGITFSKWRNESIKGYGNAIVPQIAYRIFSTINELDL